MKIQLDVHGSKLCEESGDVKSFGESLEFDSSKKAVAVDKFSEAMMAGHRIEVSGRIVTGDANQPFLGLFDLRSYEQEVK